MKAINRFIFQVLQSQSHTMSLCRKLNESPMNNKNINKSIIQPPKTLLMFAFETFIFIPDQRLHRHRQK